MAYDGFFGLDKQQKWGYNIDIPKERSCTDEYNEYQQAPDAFNAHVCRANVESGTMLPLVRYAESLTS